MAGLNRRSVLAAASVGAIGVLAEPLMPLTAEERFVIVDGWVLAEDDVPPAPL